MSESTFIPAEKETEQMSFTSYIKEKYSYYKLFLPKHKPSNDIISAEELSRLEKLIRSRDHFEIRKEITKKYGEN
jgi:hypothetical protein